MIDNFKLIRDYLKFYNDNTFYFCQLIKRKKDNPDLEHNNEVVHSYYIYSKEDLDALEKKIKDTCKKENCRAYINLNDLDLERVSMNAMIKTAQHIREHEYKNIIKVWSEACGATGGATDKLWLIDLDDDEVNLQDEIISYIDNLEPLSDETKLRLVVPTAHGKHLMVRPFNLNMFSRKYNTDEFVHKDNPTILYIP